MSAVEGWVTSSLSLLLHFMKSGGTPNTSLSDYYGGEIPFVTIEDMTASSRHLTSTIKSLTPEGLKNSNAWLVPTNSILYSIYATLGLPRINTVPVATNQAILALVNDPKLIDRDYLYYWLEHIRATVVNLSSQTTQSNLSATTVKSFLVDHPIDLSEQAKIAEILSTVDQAIEQTEALIVKQQRIKTGLMQDLFTRGIDENGNLRSEETHTFKDSPLGRIPVEWEVKSLEQLTTKIVDGVHQTPNYVESGIPFIVITNLTEGSGINFSNTRFVSVRDHCEFSKRADPKAGDVLVTKDGTLGVARVVPTYAPEFSIFVSVAMLRPKQDICLPDLIWAFFESGEFRFQLGSLSAGTGLTHIHLEHFHRFLLCCPPIDEQNMIFFTINKQQDLLNSLFSELHKLKKLKTGLMQDLLTGKKRVTALLKGTEVNA